MPAFKYFKTFEHNSIGDGETASGSWTADEDLILKRVHVIRKDGASFTDSEVYFNIGDRVFARDKIPAVVLGPDKEVSPVLNIPFRKGEKLEYKFKNNEGSTISIYICIEVWTP